MVRLEMLHAKGDQLLAFTPLLAFLALSSESFAYQKLSPVSMAPAC